MKRWLLLMFVVLMVAGGAAAYSRLGAAPPKDPFRMTEVTRGDLVITVSATGTVEPEEVVDVGAQVMGRVSELGADPRGKTDPAFAGKHIDYCSPVEKDMILARIDPTIYDAQLQQASAALKQAEASVLQNQAQAVQAEAEWERAQKLRNLKLKSVSPSGSAPGSLSIVGISDADFILAKANHDSAVANLEAAKATVQQQQAATKLAQANVDFTTIFSPVDGTIIDRRVNIGQTVVASLNAPSLFLIARDLRRMQVWAAVNEADIGRLKVGTKVHFSVDAYPDDVFYGVVQQVRLNASMTQNVVTYIVVVATDNSNLRLLPYLTADVKFEVDERKDVLLVPNGALRFQPREDQIDPQASTREAATEEAPEDSAEETGIVWLLAPDGIHVRPKTVRVGLTDGSLTEVSGDGVEEGLQVVAGQARVESAVVNNPFMPKIGRLKGKNKSGNKQGK